ncbi:hypothetical protein ACVWXN_006693 [Bradyrhizobium sp. i1.4.4]
MLAQRFIEAGYQLHTGKGFGEKASYTGAQRAGSRAIIREGSNQDEWRGLTLGSASFAKVQSRSSWASAGLQ